jgi:hypothetical protein
MPRQLLIHSVDQRPAGPRCYTAFDTTQPQGRQRGKGGGGWGQLPGNFYNLINISRAITKVLQFFIAACAPSQPLNAPYTCITLCTPPPPTARLPRHPSWSTNSSLQLNTRSWLRWQRMFFLGRDSFNTRALFVVYLY